jgi:hypothetical protein
MTPLKTYDFSRVLLIVGGFEISGYGEDGGIEFEYPSDTLEHVAGADGQVTVSRTNDNRMIAHITVMETSRAYRDLATLARTQAAQLAIGPLPFLMRCLTTGDEVPEQFAAFIQLPTPNKAKTAGERVFDILLPNAKKLAKFGSNILI